MLLSPRTATARLLLITLLTWTPSAFAAATTYTIKKAKLRVKVHHPAKKVKVKTKAVTGKVVTTSKVTAGKEYKLSGKFSVNIEDLASGNKRRDGHMRNALGLHVQKIILFQPKLLSLKAKTLKGAFTIRNVTKDVALTVTKFSFKKDGAIALKLKGTLKCSDFKIPRPSLFFVKIRDLVKLKLKFTMVETKTPTPPKGK